MQLRSRPKMYTSLLPPPAAALSRRITTPVLLLHPNHHHPTMPHRKCKLALGSVLKHSHAPDSLQDETTRAGSPRRPLRRSILPRIALSVRAPLPAPLCAAHHVPPLRAAPAARTALALPTLPPLTPLTPLTPAGRLE